MPERRRVAVTGLGLVTAHGNDVPTAWRRICAGENLVSRIERFDASGYPVDFAVQVTDFDPGRWIAPRQARLMDPFAQFAVAASAQAWDDAGLSEVDGDRLGVVIGSGTGGYDSVVRQAAVLAATGPRTVDPYYVPAMLANMAGAQVAIRYGAHGPSSCPATACAAGAHAIGQAMRWIQHGEADVVIAGGSEYSVHPLSVAGFTSMRALALAGDDPRTANRPFDVNRRGFVLGEGAGVVVLEDWDGAVARGARIYAELAGYGATSDAKHTTAPDPAGRGAAASMRRAIADAEIKPDEIGYVNAHATATKLGDAAEIAALADVFGDHVTRLLVSATKSTTGHMLGASGAVEFILTVLALATGTVAPTLNLDEPDPAIRFDPVAHTARAAKLTHAMSNSFAFGGHNASLLAAAVTHPASRKDLG